jgi:alpha-galactosidase
MPDHEMSPPPDGQRQHGADRTIADPVASPGRSMATMRPSFVPETVGQHLVGAVGGTGVALIEYEGRLPSACWVGVVEPGLTANDVCGLATPGLSLLPEHAHGWYGRPGLAGHRGTDERGAWSSWFVPCLVEVSPSGALVEAVDSQAELALRTEVQVAGGGMLRVRHALTNQASAPYVLDALDVMLPLPDRAVESLDFTGRWGRERVPQRRPITDGLWAREIRRGKTGHDSPTVLMAGTAGFGFAAGEVWGVHVAWSGNSTYRLEQVPLGKQTPTRTIIGGGELLLPGEVILGPGEAYTSPWVYVGASDHGLDGLAERFHGYVRSGPAHPRTPRPVTLNVWEAVYFEHDLGRLKKLADRAAQVGVERYVLDDGWFSARRDARAGLGDWTVSTDVWPDGLAPLADYVHALGMQFGLWFEPEMINANSQLFKAHPDWILATGGRIPPEERSQQVLDLAQPGAYRHVLEQVSKVLSSCPIEYVKWDHNRDFIDAGSGIVNGRPGAHAQTLAFYRLLDELRSRHPRIEWESCASGGGRVDLAVLDRVERVWTSDQNDALARQAIQRWTAQLVPPEYIGAHVAAPCSHQTRRVLPLDFRAATALFGHFGIEWDITSATQAELDRLAEWVALYKKFRRLLHSGRMFRLDSPAEAVWVHGVISPSRDQAMVACVQLDEQPHEPPAIRIPGLRPETSYAVERVGAGESTWPPYAVPKSPVNGAALANVGLPGPHAAPSSVVLLYLRTADAVL